MSYHQTAIALGILIQMDERDVLALGRKKQDIQKGGGQPTFKKAFNASKGAETPAHSPAKERKLPATGTEGGYSKEELKLIFPSAFGGKLGYVLEASKSILSSIRVYGRCAKS
jgi:hypothetical protein